MNISIDINIRASEDITNSLLTLAAVLHNAVPIFDKGSKVIEPKEEPTIKSKEVETPKEKIETSKEKVEILNQEIKEITLQEVRGVLTSLSENGKRSQVKALIKKFGATKITEIPKEKYAELLKAADFIN